METLLSVVVVAIAVVGFVVTARLKMGMDGNEVRLGLVRAQLTALEMRAQESEERSRKIHEDYSNAIEEIREEVRKALARSNQDTNASRAIQGGLSSKVKNMQAALENEARQRQEAIRELQEELQSTQELTQQLEQSVHGEIAELRTQRGHDIEQRVRDLSELRTEAGSAKARAAAVENALGEVRAQLAEAREQADQGIASGARDILHLATRLTETSRRTEHSIAGSARDISYLDQHLIAVRQHVKQRLDDEVAGVPASARTVLVDGIYTGQAAAAEALPVFYEALCVALSAEILFREPRGKEGIRYYLRWEPVSGTLPEHRLEPLLDACPRNTGEFYPGLDELRSLVLAIDNSEPAAVQVGPMIVSRAHGSLLGGFLVSRDAVAFDALQAAVHADDHESFRLAMEPGTVQELSSWASHAIVSAE